MKKICGYVLFLMLSLIGFVATANEGTAICSPVTKEVFYTVRPSDQLGMILWRFNVGRLWGKRHLVNKTAKVNGLPQKDFIKPGEAIRIPFACEEDVQKYVVEERDQVRWVLYEQRAISSVIAEASTVVPAPTPAPMQEQAKEPLPPVPLKEEKVETPALVVALPAPEVKVAPVVVATPAPTPIASLAPVCSAKNEDTDFSDLSFSFSGQYSILEGKERDNGTTGRLLSKFNGGAEATWSQHWDDTFRSSIFAGFVQNALYNEKHGIPLTNDTLTTTNFGLGFFGNLSDRLEVGLSLAEIQGLFYSENPSGTGLELDSVPLLQVHPELTLRLLQRKHLSLSLTGGYSFYSSASFDNYSIDAGTGYDAGLLLKHQFDSGSDIHCLTNYVYRQQNTSLLILTQKDVGVQCGFTWRAP